MTITKDQIESHGLKPEEYEKIKKIMGRDPNLLELGIFSAMWVIALVSTDQFR